MRNRGRLLAAAATFAVLIGLVATPAHAVAPSAPSVVASVRGIGTNTVDVYWNIPSDGDPVNQFELELRSPDTSGTLLTRLTMSGSLSGYTLTNLQDGTYGLRVRALTDGGDSAFGESNTVVVNTAAPAAPTAFLASSTPGSTSISLTWANPTSGFDSVRLERQSNGGSWSIVTPGGFAGTSKNLTNLSDGSYQFRVSAFNGAHQSAFTELADPVLIDTTPPNTPTVAAALVAPGSAQVNVSWNASTYNLFPVTGYRVERWVSGLNTGTLIATTDASTLSLTDTVNADGSYVYAVKAISVLNLAIFGESLPVTVDASLPDAPSDVHVTTSSEHSIAVTWANPISNFASVVVQRHIDGGAWTTISSASFVGATLLDLDLADGVYAYRIATSKPSGQSAWVVTDDVRIGSIPAPDPDPAPAQEPVNPSPTSGSVPTPPAQTVPTSSSAVPGLTLVSSGPSRPTKANGAVTTSIVHAPVVTAKAGTACAAVLSGLPHATQLVVGLGQLHPQFMRSRSWQTLGTVRTSASGTAKLPAVKLATPGKYVFQLTMGSGRSFYSKLLVVKAGKK